MKGLITVNNLGFDSTSVYIPGLLNFAIGTNHDMSHEPDSCCDRRRAFHAIAYLVLTA